MRDGGKRPFRILLLVGLAVSPMVAGRIADGGPPAAIAEAQTGGQETLGEPVSGPADTISA